MLVSVIAGARVVQAADRTVEVYAAAASLPAGHVLATGDVRVVRARLQGGVAEHVAATYAVAGQTLAHDVLEGELLSRGVLVAGQPRPSRHVSVAVKRGHAAEVSRNSRVDVIASTTAGSEREARTWTVAKGLLVVSKPTGSSSVGGGELHVVLDVPAELVLPLTKAMRTAEIDLVQVVGTGPATGDIGDGDAPGPAAATRGATPSASPSS
jgi:hypothetical protein